MYCLVVYFNSNFDLKINALFISIISACNCKLQGSVGDSCDDGKCSCKPNIIGDTCYKCAEGYKDFPSCIVGKDYN